MYHVYTVCCNVTDPPRLRQDMEMVYDGSLQGAYFSGISQTRDQLLHQQNV